MPPTISRCNPQELQQKRQLNTQKKRRTTQPLDTLPLLPSVPAAVCTPVGAALQYPSSFLHPRDAMGCMHALHCKSRQGTVIKSSLSPPYSKHQYQCLPPLHSVLPLPLKMSGAAAPSPKVVPISPSSPGAADDEPSSYASASGSIFAAFGRAPSFKAPLRVQVVKFTREDEGFVNYDITVSMHVV